MPNPHIPRDKMRRQTPIAHLLYAQLYPNPQPSDPPSFSAHLARNLVPEVRIEVATYYGDLSSTESRYPGLNYCYGPHRMRLGRFKHHRRLFDAFAKVGLTEQEVQDFCCWEGTRWARERYERDEGVKVVDTTGDDIAQFVDRRIRRKEQEERRGSITRKTDISIVVEETTAGAANRASSSSSQHLQPDAPFTYTGTAQPASPPSEDDYMSDESSSATALPPASEPAHETAARLAHIRDLERQRAQAISARLLAAWESGEQLDPELEQYLKEQSEQRGGSGQLRGLDLTSFISATIARRQEEQQRELPPYRSGVMSVSEARERLARATRAAA